MVPPPPEDVPEAALATLPFPLVAAAPLPLVGELEEEEPLALCFMLTDLQASSEAKK